MTFLDCIYTCLVEPLHLLFEIVFFYAYKWTHNAGTSILVLSLVVNFLLLPLYVQADKIEREQKEKKKRMKKWSDHIKNTFKGNERVMMTQAYNRINNYKVTDIFKESISLMLQIPFFIAAYSFLSGMELLQHASLGPIADLGKPDALLKIGSFSINAFPILMTLINIAAGFIYTEKGQIKEKLKLVLIAMVFLVLLYGSPSGLVFYWTLNNVFSLVKNIVMKSKAKSPEESNSLQDKRSPAGMKLILLSGAVLAVVSGLWIPSDVVAENPEEMINLFISNPHDPALYLLSSFMCAVGLFVIWIPLFFYLLRNKVSKLIPYIATVVSFGSAMNYFLFNKRFGLLSDKLIYDNPMRFRAKDLVFNILANIAVIVVSCLVARYLKKLVAPLLSVILLTAIMVSLFNIQVTEISMKNYSYSYSNTREEVIAPMTTKGKNVVVIMMDRMMGAYIPFIFNERPDVAKQFDGFTYYPNTVSFGQFTNFGAPAVFGGYDYTPEMMNSRPDESLMDKHNEALRVLPTIFADNGWKVSVGDPTYANYRWIPDPSIYDNDDRINAFQMAGVFNEKSELFVEAGKKYEDRLNRNLFCYGVMKTLPCLFQPALYTDGQYYQVDNYFGNDEQVGYVEYSMREHTQIGIYEAYYSQYLALTSLNEIVEINQDEENCFFIFSNGVAHDANLLQEPEYLPSVAVNNTEYDATHQDRFELNGVTLHLDETSPAMTYGNYQTNMAACIELGKWFDFLRENGLYDNTRIIIVADHGNIQRELDDLMVEKLDFSAQSMNPLLMVKDFNSNEFTTSYEFMTNADTPYLALNGIVDEPVNPFTNHPITSDKSGEQHVYISEEWSTLTNNGNVFEGGTWLSVKDDIYDDDNWKQYNPDEE